MSYTFDVFCFSRLGVSCTYFTACYFPKGSEKWRHEGCVNAVVENLRQCLLKVRLLDFRSLGAMRHECGCGSSHLQVNKSFSVSVPIGNSRPGGRA